MDVRTEQWDSLKTQYLCQHWWQRHAKSKYYIIGATKAIWNCSLYCQYWTK